MTAITFSHKFDEYFDMIHMKLDIEDGLCVYNFMYTSEEQDSISRKKIIEFRKAIEDENKIIKLVVSNNLFFDYNFEDSKFVITQINEELLVSKTNIKINESNKKVLIDMLNTMSLV